MAEPDATILFDEAMIAARVDALADALADALSRDMDDEWVVIALLQGALPFAADLMRALARRGVHPVLDCLWLESYSDARESSGRVVVRADISRSVEGRRALILDDIYDSGRTIDFARAHIAAKGALETKVCAFVRKPSAPVGGVDLVGLEAPEAFLIGYGMDDAGRWRGLPYIAALTAP